MCVRVCVCVCVCVPVQKKRVGVEGFPESWISAGPDPPKLAHTPPGLQLAVHRGGQRGAGDGWGTRLGGVSAVHVVPAGGVGVEVVFAQGRGVVGSGVNITGGEWRVEEVTSLIWEKIVLVQCL